MAQYNVISEFTDATGAVDFTSCSPFWIICVIPLALPLSFSRSTMTSLDALAGAGADLRTTDSARLGDGGKIIITSDCMSMSITSQKGRSTKSLGAQLMQTDRNYLVDILPGDWVMAWVVNNEDRGREILQKIRKGDACNDFKDGLKFVGRIESIRKRIERSPDGALSSTYNLSASAFGELETQIFYDQQLADKGLQGSIGISSWLARFGIDIEDLIQENLNGLLSNNVHKIIPRLVNLMLGKGISETVNLIPDLPAVVGAGAGTDEPPYAHLVPVAVSKMLGNPDSSAASYCTIMRTIFGVQDYANSNPETAPYKVFSPTITDGSGGSFQYTGKPMLGAFIPVMPPLTNSPLWGVLQQFLNPSVNELYTCLRVGDDGKVVPTLMLRQIPFTTEAFAAVFDERSKEYGSNKDQIHITRFLSLPRWVIHKSMVSSLDIGRSNATHFNFVHVYGQNRYSVANVNLSQQLANNPPIHDDIDIQRSGVRVYSTNVAVAIFDQADRAPRVWMELIADMMMGSQFTINGTMQVQGISLPICEGDNLEFDGVCYHIEGFTHTCSIDSEGNRLFNTTLQISNGLLIDPRPGEQFSDTDSYGKTIQYPGFSANSATRYDPGITHDDDGKE